MAKRFEKNNTIYFQCKFSDIEGSPYDPLNPRYTIRNAKNEILTQGTPTKKSLGVFYFYWKPSTLGHHTVIFEGKIGDHDVLGKKIFEVIETKP